MGPRRWARSLSVCMLLWLAVPGVLCAQTTVWLTLDPPSSPTSPGAVFTTALKLSSSNGAVGALDATINYDPGVLRLVEFSTPPSSGFFPDSFTQPTAGASGQTRLACFQIAQSAAPASPVLLGTLRWEAIGPLGSSTAVSIVPKTVVEASWGGVEVFAYGQQIVVDWSGEVTVAWASAAGLAREDGESYSTSVRVTTLSGAPLAAEARVSYTSANGTAKAPTDYATTSGTLIFPAGSPSGTTQAVTIPIVDDALAEGDETFTLTLSSPVGATLGSPAVQMVRIPLNDGLANGLVAVAAGGLHTCVVTSSGAVWCWGSNAHGQLGDGTTADRLMPVAVGGLASEVVTVTAGASHTCALTSAGAVWCWGLNSSGQVGDGTTADRLAPVAVSGLGSGVVAVAAGDSHTCAVSGSGAVQCWGTNGHGQLGNGTTTPQPTPVEVSGLGGDVAGAAAGASHTCVMTSAGAVWCWGWNNSGQLGDGTTTDRLTPVAVSGLASGVLAVAAGQDHTCAVTSDGAVQCWGTNASGQLGDGTTTNRLAPVGVSGLGSGVVAVAGGGGHACAVTNGGALLCWGQNASGQLGDGTTTDRATPVAATGMGTGVLAVAAGANHTCAITGGAAAQCWGLNSSGQLGDRTMTDRWAPVPVVALFAPPAIDAIRPSVGPIGGGTAVTLTGSNFVVGATVTLGGVPAASATVVSATRITARTPAHAEGAVAVVLTTPDGQAATLAGGFTYVTQSSLTPAAFDFNGDGTGDRFRYDAVTGSWTLELIDAHGSLISTLGRWSPGWSVFPGDFNGDGLSDLFVYNVGTGAWYKCVSDGTSGFTYIAGSWSPNWQVHVGDYNGDGTSDVFVYNPTSGAWYTCLTVGADGSGFSYVGGGWSPGWQVFAMDLDGNGRTDIFVYNDTSGLWYRCMSDGTGRFTYRDGIWTIRGWHVHGGDFDGDGLRDLFLYNPTNGNWFVCRNTGSEFVYQPGQWSPGWTVAMADFDGDGRSDVFVYNVVTGAWYQCVSNGQGFDYYLGQWSPGWQLQVGDFNGDGRSDLLVYNPTTGGRYTCVSTELGQFDHESGNWGPGWTVLASR